jgi:hypothetical protein
MAANGLIGRYHFFSWAGAGLRLALRNADNPAVPAPIRPQLKAELTIQAEKAGAVADTKTADMTVNIFGPADVLGIDPRLVVRTEPRHLTANFEPNYLTAIDFAEPDLPWLMTPAAPSGDRLRPWICLVALRPGEFQFSAEAPHPLPRISVTALDALPDPGVSWAWAHVQVAGDLPANGLAGVLATAPENVISRLLCPRQLDPDEHYFSFLVPAFEAGRLSGLGLDSTSVTTDVAAWPPTPGAASLDLPYYYSFEFHTSDRGDFESMVRQTVPRVLPPEVGIRPMDVDHPASPPFPGAGPPLGLGGALRSVQTTETDWQDPGKAAFQASLQDLINLTTPPNDDPDHPNPKDPQVVPSIYGCWAAAVRSADRAGGRWIDTVNLDPRHRAEAGFGTRVVGQERNALLASAWAQVGGVELANQRLRQAQLSRMSSLAAYGKHFTSVTDEVMLSLTQAVHSKLLASPQTVTATIAQTRLPVRAFSGAFRRVARPQGPLRRRQGVTGSTAATVAARINAGDVRMVPPTRDPNGMQSIDATADSLIPAWIPGWLRPLLQYALGIVAAIFLALAALVLVIGIAAGAVGAALAIAGAILAIGAVLAVWLYRKLPAWTAAGSIRFERLTPQTIAAAGPRSTFAVVPAGQPYDVATGTGTDTPEAARFRQATEGLALGIQAAAKDSPPPPAADLAALRATVQLRLDPAATVPTYALARVLTGPMLVWAPGDPIAPIMACPVIDQPMYEPLRNLSQEYLLPGLENIPPDTMALVITNQPFIESYMVGLNHEMARQLLWERYPTDLRGSPFRQFWDVRSYVPEPGGPADPAALAEMLRDIKPINQWPLTNSLGENGNRPQLVPENLVLLLCNELLRRYPDALIYARQAQWDAKEHKRTLGQAEKWPLFRGTLNPNITFFGFDLTPGQARGGDPSQGGDPGWFFVFQQHPHERRFGLEPLAKDPVKAWADLAWSDFPWQPQGPGAPLFLSPDLQPQNLGVMGPSDAKNSWGINAAQTAYILDRAPALIAVHASLMLPLGAS